MGSWVRDRAQKSSRFKRGREQSLTLCLFNFHRWVGNHLGQLAIDWDRWQSIGTGGNQLIPFAITWDQTVGNQLVQLAINWDSWQSIGTVGNELGPLAIN